MFLAIISTDVYKLRLLAIHQAIFTYFVCADIQLLSCASIHKIAVNKKCVVVFP